ncbi:MAG: TonB-dependent receptor, partial [Enterobacterales bacterium]|nr:TonB-dependent receptor [Enterobacterales bacterium]
GFEPVAGRNKSGAAYKPESSKMWEGGVKFATPSQNTIFTAAIFDIKKKNALTPSAITYELSQAGEIESKGYELEVRTSPLENLLLTANYAYTDVKITEDSNPEMIGKRPIQTAKDNASAWANYTIDDTFLRGLTVGAGIRYMGRMEANKDNTDQLPSVTLYDMAASYELGNLTPALDNATLKMAVNNITDKRYVASCYDSNNCWFGAERSVVVGVKYSF